MTLPRTLTLYKYIDYLTTGAFPLYTLTTGAPSIPLLLEGIPSMGIPLDGGCPEGVYMMKITVAVAGTHIIDEE